MASVTGSLFDEIDQAVYAFPAFRISLAGYQLEIRIESESLAAQLKPALEHIETKQRDRSPDLTITAFDRAPPEALSIAHWLPAQTRDPSLSVRAMDDRGLMHIDATTGIVSLFDAHSNRAGVWFGARPPIWVASAPFLRILDAFYIRRGMLLCHGAAVAKNGRAVLIVGSSGAGKSTLSINACYCGYEYLGDDYVLLDPSAASPAMVHSVHRSGRLVRAELAPEFIAKLDIQQEAEDPTEKSYFLPNDKAIRLVAPLAAIVQPKQRLADEPALLPYPAAKAVRATVTDLFHQLQGYEQRKLEILTRIFHVPCYELHLSLDHRKNVAALDRILR